MLAWCVARRQFDFKVYSHSPNEILVAASLVARSLRSSLAIIYRMVSWLWLLTKSPFHLLFPTAVLFPPIASSPNCNKVLHITVNEMLHLLLYPSHKLVNRNISKRCFQQGNRLCLNKNRPPCLPFIYILASRRWDTRYFDPSFINA